MTSGVYVRSAKMKQQAKKRLLSYVLGKKGNKNNNWTDSPKYQAIHVWLRTNFGKASYCENRKNQTLSFTCRKSSMTFVWALIPGKDYARNRQHFMQLCQSCNILCEVTAKFRSKMSKVNIQNWKNYKLINKL